MTSLYDPIVSGVKARDAVQDTLKLWMPAYLAEVAAQHGRDRGALPNIRSYTTSLSKLAKFKASQFPACVFVAPGIMGRPVQEGDKRWRATWAVGIGFYVSGNSRENIEENLQLYVAAGRSAILQHRSLGGIASSVEWLDEQYDSVAFDKSRTFQAGVVSLGVEIRSVVNSAAGPTTPPSDPTDPPGEVPTVQEVFVTTQGLPS